MKRDKYTAVLGNTVVYHDMSTLTEKRPLANLPFDGKYRLIDFQLSNLANAGIHNIYAIFRGYNIHSVFDHVRSGREWGLNTLLSHYFLGFYEEQHSSELANRDYYEQILTYLKRSGSEQTVYMNCDILCNIDLAQVIHLHEVSDGNITVVYKKMPKEAISDANEILDIDETDHVIGRTTIDDNLELQKMSADIYVAKTPWCLDFAIFYRDKQAGQRMLVGFDNQRCRLVLNLFFNQAAQVARAVLDGVGFIGQILNKRFVPMQLNAVMLCGFNQILQHDAADLLEVLGRQLIERNDLVNAVDKLRTHDVAQRLERLFAALLCDGVAKPNRAVTPL